MEEFYRIGKAYMGKKVALRGIGGHGKISYMIGAEYGINHATVERAEKFAIGIDAVRAYNSILADDILHGKTPYTKQDIVAIGSAKPENREEMIERLLSGELSKSLKNYKRRKHTEADPQTVDRKKIEAAVNGLYVTAEKYDGTERLVRDIMLNAEPFIGMLRRIIEQNREACRNGRYSVLRAIDENIILKLRMIEEEIEKC